jgi:hypothetical protein
VLSPLRYPFLALNGYSKPAWKGDCPEHLAVNLALSLGAIDAEPRIETVNNPEGQEAVKSLKYSMLE